MKLFAQLLSEYTRRTGISDAELARHLGVRRQTIFRWREGLTQRPREREDVLRLADKLRLSAEERDELLLAAGFAPEGSVAATGVGRESSPEANASYSEAAFAPPDAAAPPASSSRPQSWVWALALFVALVTLVVLARSQDWGRQAAMRLGIPLPTPTLQAGQPVPAGPGETLILIGEFANYGGETIGYNVAGRLQEALRSELEAAGLEQARVETFPEVLTSQAQASAAGEALGAALVLWGEYDSGRVVAAVTVPSGAVAAEELRRFVEDPEELNAVVNIDLPAELRWITLITLGQLRYLSGDLDKAEAVFQQALSNPPENIPSRATADFYLGLIASRQHPPQWSRAIAYYDEAIARNQNLLSAYNNRAVAYLQRGEPGDLAASEADLRQVIALDPNFVPAHLNLGIVLARRYPDERSRALQSFLSAYELDPESAAIDNALCWNYSLAGQAEQALPFCERAVSLDPGGYNLDSRGLTYALLGRYDEAAADFEAFLSYLGQHDPDAYDSFRETRSAWIEALRQGRNPFDDATLAQLRQE